MKRVHDAIVVGSGCSGGWVAKELTQAGLGVLMLEAGPSIDPSTIHAGTWTARHAPPSREAWRAPASQRIQSRHGGLRRDNARFFVDDDEHPYTTDASKPFHWIRGRQLGGRSLTWGRLCLRLSNLDMTAGSLDSMSDDWPISYDDLARHYSAVERFLAVRGSVEGLPQLPDGDYLPAAPLTPGEEWLREGMQKLWPDRRVIAARGIDCDVSAESPWPKFTSTGSTLAAAQATGRLELQADSVVRQVFTLAGQSKVGGVHWIDRSNSTEHEALARVVVLCASTIESARILLNSSTRAHRNGLGNAADVLGRYLMDHPFVAIVGRGEFPRAPTLLPFIGPHGIVIPRFRNLGGAERCGYHRGFGIWGGVDRGDLFGGRYMLLAYGEMLPKPHNRVTLSPHRRDRWGVPLVHIECEWGSNERRMMRDASECLEDIAAQMHLDVGHRSELSEPGEFVHEVGTARMGASPDMSFVNPRCQNWQLDNLFVGDGSLWTTGGYQNPTLTTMALARHCAHAILDRFRAGSV